MSSRSMSVPKKFSDAQFIGDLINLFERRKIQCGDPGSFQTFESELASNDALRSGLFTLCTAISHMAEEDLTGEQLLTLVARALAGPTVPKGAAIDIPDSMRSAFLSGYQAWSNRDFDIRVPDHGSEIKEPIAWPAPRPAAPQGEFAQPSSDVTLEPVAPRPPAPGVRTLQEALELAKTRFPAEPALPHPADMGSKSANIEGLTLGELKQLLQDIEQRVTRIQPQVREPNSRPPAADFGRREKMHEIDEALSAHAPEDDPPAALHRSPSPSRLNEAAFLARHAYMRPTRRVVPEPSSIGLHAAPITAAGAATAPVTQLAANPSPFVAAAPAAAPMPIAAEAPAPFVAAAPAPFAAPVSAPAAATIQPAAAVAQPVATVTHPAEIIPFRTFEPTILPIAVPQLPRQYEATEQLAQLRAAMTDDSATPRPGSIYFRIGNMRLGPRTVVGSLVAFIIIAGGLGGVLIYPSLHPTYFYSNSKLLPASALSTDATQSAAPAGDTASPAQVILTAPEEGPLIPQPAQNSHATATAASKTRLKTPPPPPVSVWPATNPAPAISVQAATLSVASASQTARRTTSSSAPVYVPSTTIIGYALTAPQPIYPRDQPKGIIGTVVLQVTISKDGDVTDIRTLSGPEQMRPATVQAVQAWHFRPYFVNGYPVEVTTTLGFLFKGQ